LRVICSWCNKELQEKEPFEDKQISHGMCRDCKEDMQRVIDRHFFKEKEVEK